ncbi:MAG: hypothetical protein ACYTGH_17340 [Planctomycetota bacterium]|jgi:hypothetical protein
MPVDDDNLRARALFRGLFPHGFSGKDVVAELSIVDWNNSPYVVFLHPSRERAYSEYIQMCNSLGRFGSSPKDHLSYEAYCLEYPDDCERNVYKQDQELADLIGMCCWDIFSDNHDVIDPSGARISIGSFRGAGSFLAEFADTGFGEEDAEYTDDCCTWVRDRFDHMRFYMGTVWIRGRGDLTPLYRLIFRRMKASGLDWHFSFPHLGVVDLSGLADGSREKDADWVDYDPAECLRRERERREEREKVARMESELAAAEEESRAEARREEPPETVQAYRSVYRRLPEGWPP